MVSQRFLLLARPEWSVLHKRTLTLGSPPPVAIESKGVTRTADAAQDLGAGGRHDGNEQHRREPDRFGGVEEHLGEPIGGGRILRERPRRRLGDELVGSVNQPIDRRRAFVERQAVHRPAIVGRDLLS
jgi:hypothetical protein